MLSVRKRLWPILGSRRRVLVRRRNIIKFLFVLLITIIISSVIIWVKPIVDLDNLVSESESFQYNMITLSATLAGFLFTGISILISSLGNERIKRLWDNNYLDNLYRSSCVGMVASVLIIIIAFCLMLSSLPEGIKSTLGKFQILSIIVMLVFFSWCVLRLISVVKKLKDT